MEITGAVALVTGANRGIGKALVAALVDRRAEKIYAAARRLADAERVARLDPRRIIPIQLDVTKGSELSAAAATARDVTLLFNNAGVLDFGSVLDASPEAVKRNFDVNCFGLLHATRAFAPALSAHRGAVVNILTVVAFASMPGIGVYNASKAAAWSLTQSLRADLRKKNVKVFGVFPGPVDTDMAKDFPIAKTAPETVAHEVLNGLETDDEDIFPDPMSKQVYSSWSADHKAVERQFATM